MAYVNPMKRLHTIEPIYSSYCNGQSSIIAFNCGYMLETCCEKATRWFIDTQFCPFCRVSEYNRISVIELILWCSHSPHKLDPAPNHRYDSCITGAGLPFYAFNKKTETWLSKKPRKLLISGI
jgi:hypothetical protein